MEQTKGAGTTRGLGQKIVISMLAMQIVVMTILSFLVIQSITKDTRNSTINSLKTIVQERCQIIMNYVEEAEGTLTAYSRAGEILDIMQNPGDPAITAAAQEYTEKFSGDIDNLEGLYASEWDTHVLAHTNAGVVGITTRTGDALAALQATCVCSAWNWENLTSLDAASLRLFRAIFSRFLWI